LIRLAQTDWLAALAGYRTKEKRHMAFPPELAAALEAVLTDCKGANTHMTVDAPGHPDDVRDVRSVQEAMATIGVSLQYGEAHNLWNLVSLDNQESWSASPESAADILTCVEILCVHVAGGCDYAGISRPAI